MMSNLTEIAKENGAFVYSDGHIGLHPHQLQATVEQVCKPLIECIEFMHKRGMFDKDFISTLPFSKRLAMNRLYESYQACLELMGRE
jgi:hypothetical protein